MLWSFARENGVPFSQTLSKVSAVREMVTRASLIAYYTRQLDTRTLVTTLHYWGDYGHLHVAVLYSSRIISGLQQYHFSKHSRAVFVISPDM